MSAQEVVSRMIVERSRANDYCKRLFIPEPLYDKLIEEIEPIYKKQFGALITEPNALKDGFENVLFAGCAVCLEPNLATPSSPQNTASQPHEPYKDTSPSDDKPKQS